MLALWVLVGSAIPFVPTGEVVSAAAAVGSYSKLNAWLIFLITWVCSVIGDCLLLLQVRFGARCSVPGSSGAGSHRRSVRLKPRSAATRSTPLSPAG